MKAVYSICGIAGIVFGILAWSEKVEVTQFAAGCFAFAFALTCAVLLSRD